MSARPDYRLYRKRTPVLARVGKFALILVSCFVIWLAVTTFLFDSTLVASVSMQPGIAPRERLFVSPLVFGPELPFVDAKLAPVRPPVRGELVTVRPPYYHTTRIRRIAVPLVSFFTARRVDIEIPPGLEFEQEALLRRVIALPGDTVRLDRFVAEVRPAGTDGFVDEYSLARHDYDITFDALPEGWNSSLPASDTMDELVLGENEYFVLADNRSITNDSRYWGPIDISRLTGKIIFRYWPLDSIGVPR
jgi:signal peptidase I